MAATIQTLARDSKTLESGPRLGWRSSLMACRRGPRDSDADGFNSPGLRSDATFVSVAQR